MYLELLDKYEKERARTGLPVRAKRHEACFDFALWLEQNAAQQSAQAAGAKVCHECGSDVVVCMMGHYCGEVVRSEQNEKN